MEVAKTLWAAFSPYEEIEGFEIPLDLTEPTGPKPGLNERVAELQKSEKM